jgi:hypothetical protein
MLATSALSALVCSASGVRVLVLNSSLLISPELVPEHAATQRTWLVEELEQCKLCAMQVVVFSFHSFFEQEGEGGQEGGQEEGAGADESTARYHSQSRANGIHCHHISCRTPV